MSANGNLQDKNAQFAGIFSGLLSYRYDTCSCAFLLKPAGGFPGGHIRRYEILMNAAPSCEIACIARSILPLLE
ncbi:hypothetical protein EQO05_08665 [Methanosarcina sp. MSH10X1]|uniref:hypothetical protein n=1 Tax=Methanosarcina sp. MSH10X1 TaxID=2507075 RepID=UPI000FFBA1DC|nr:hypothetical protein [Methanosarcina sp. MSH10X1]RXA19657.1 hypothetical protein EQO05_08665 [Methanosarcina sp. MSH10X1]